MNWDQIKGNWNQLKGSARQKFAELNDDELEQIAGDRDKLVGRVQERRGLTREEAERHVDDWSRSV